MVTKVLSACLKYIGEELIGGRR